MVCGCDIEAHEEQRGISSSCLENEIKKSLSKKKL